jgi:hypothetical protein
MSERDGRRDESTPHKNIMRNNKESVKITSAIMLAQRVQKPSFKLVWQKRKIQNKNVYACVCITKAIRIKRSDIGALEM